MDQNLSTLIQWAFAHPLTAFLILGAPPLVAAVLTKRFLRRLKVAESFVDRQQYMRVSPDVLEDLDAYATNRGREVFVREALGAIREQHGHDGVRYGHVMVLLMAIDDGHVPPTKWPSFLPPEGTPDPVFKSM